MLDVDPKKQAEDVCLIIKDLLKVVKVVSLYPETNPLPQNLKRSFAEKFESIIDDYGDIKLVVEKESLAYLGETVFADANKDEALVSLLFDAGILTLTFKSGLDVIEMYKFLDIIKGGINSPGSDYDLVNALWESELANISLTTVEDIALAAYDGDISIQEIRQCDDDDDEFLNLPPGSAPEDFLAIFGPEGGDLDGDDYEFEEGGGELVELAEGETGVETTGERPAGPSLPAGQRRRRAGPGQVRQGQPQPAGANVLSVSGLNDDEYNTSSAAEAMGFGPTSSTTATAVAPPVPDSTLILNDQFVLTAEEEEYIRKLLEEDAKFDHFESTTELAMEILHQEDDLTAFFESVTVVEKVLSEFVSQGRLAEAEKIVDYFTLLERQIASEKPLWSERLRDAKVTAGSKERLYLLVTALNARPELSPNSLKRYLSKFGWESLGNITDMLTVLNHDVHREAVRTHLASLGGKNIQIISRGIYDKRTHVIISAIQVLASVGDQQSYVHLHKVVEHKNQEVRLALVRALNESAPDQVLELLVKLAKDSSADIRKLAVNTMVSRRGRAAFDSITDLINDENFVTLIHEDRQALLIAYSKLGGEHALEYLRQTAAQYNFLHSRTIEELRSEAFAAITHNQSDRASRLLLKLTGSWRPAVKQLALESIRIRRDLIYGGDEDDDQ